MSHLDTFITQLVLMGFTMEPEKSRQMRILRRDNKSVYLHYFDPDIVYVNASWNPGNVFVDLDDAWENICREVCA